MTTSAPSPAAIPAALLCIDAGAIVWVNDAAAQLLGVGGPSELIGRPWRDFCRDAPALADTADGSDISRASVVALRLSSGEQRTVELRARPQGSGTLLALWDVTEREHAMAELRQSEASCRDYTRAAADWLWATDAAGRISHLSDELREIVGSAVDGWLSRRGSEIPAIESASDPDVAPFGQVDSGTSFRDARFFVTDRDGRRRIMEIAGVPVVDANGAFAGYRGVGRDVTDTVEADERLRWLARHDALTRLANRTLFNERLDQTLRLSRRTEQRFAVLLIDLDDFKRINDTYGHAAGDQLLVEVGARIRDVIRETDLAGRLGGDEFAVLQTAVHGFSDASVLARRLISSLNEPIILGERTVAVNASCGIALYPDDGDGPAALMRAADVALYRAKAMGGNAMLFFVPHMNDEVTQRRLLEQDLRVAIEADELELHYQPQFEIQTGRIIGLEALVRWQRRDGATVPPGLFVSVAEEYGHIHALGMWVLNEACQQVAEWLSVRHNDLKIAVNLSPVELRRDGIVEEVLATIAAAGIEPRHLALELTERARIDDSERVQATLQALASAGIELAIDDFGTGWSNLAYLQQLAVGTLKIDRSLIAGLPGRAECRSMVRAIIALARALKFRTIGKGVETRTQLQALQRMGCHVVQGHFLAPPLRAADVTTLLRQPVGGLPQQSLPPEP